MILPPKYFWQLFKSTNGALSTCESLAIINLASQAPKGTYLELGSYMGKSAMSAVRGLQGGVFHLVDPEFSNNEFAVNVGVLVASGHKEIVVDLINGYSTDIIPKLGMFAWAFVDSGSHQDGLPMQEVKLLENKMIEGGVIAFHDYNSQFKEVKEAYDYLIGTGKYEEVPINWGEIIGYVGENDLEKGNESWHHTENPFPCYVGAVKRL